MPDWTRTSSNDRRFALSVARSLHKQLFFVEVDWDDKPLRDAMDDVYQFNEIDGAGAMAYELPTCVYPIAKICSPLTPATDTQRRSNHGHKMLQSELRGG
jgi:hypothetical protein